MGCFGTTMDAEDGGEKKWKAEAQSLKARVAELELQLSQLRKEPLDEKGPRRSSVSKLSTVSSTIPSIR